MSKRGSQRSFVALLPMICEIVRSVCALKRVAQEEREEFESFTLAVFLRNNCRALEKYRGDGPLAGYLRAVIGRLLLDYRTRKWGKWRPSAEARRLGRAAVELERLIERDGFTRWEAVRHLRINLGVPRSERELFELAEQLPNRPIRRFEGEEALSGLPGSSREGERTDRCVEGEVVSLVRTALRRAVDELGPEEKRLIAQHFRDGLSVADIARRSGANQRRLYRRLATILRGLRRRLELLGIDRATSRAVLCSW
jgi:RNA polymerase sigma factor for flagellar operon FliA